MSASYSRPFLAHASIGPACAVARVQVGAIEVWSQSQSIHPTRLDIAKTLGVAPDTITIRHVQGAGCYGHNAADDAALDAVLLARAVEGHPVRLQWSHEDELAWSPFGPAMVVAMNGAVDDAGRIVDWRHEIWSNPHIARPGLQESPSLLAAWHLEPAVRAAARHRRIAGNSADQRAQRRADLRFRQSAGRSARAGAVAGAHRHPAGDRRVPQYLRDRVLHGRAGASPPASTPSSCA